MRLAHHHAGLPAHDDRGVELIESTVPLSPQGDNGKLRAAEEIPAAANKKP